MNRRLNMFLRVSTGVFLFVALVQLIVGIEPSLRESFPTYVLSLIPVILITFLPSLLEKYDLRISNSVYYTLVITTILTVSGGYGFKFYQVLKYFDTAVHFMNGAIITLITFALIKFFIKDHKEHMLKIIIASFLVSITIGTFWEIYEFVIDFFLGRNMQRFDDPSGLPLVGQEALYDTMTDLIVDALGAILATVALIRSHLSGGNFVHMYKIEKISEYE